MTAPAPLQAGDWITQAGRVPHQQPEAWAETLAAPFPVAWARRLLDNWRHQRAAVGDFRANLQHLGNVRQIEAARLAGVPADAGDAQLCTIAAESARDMARRLGQRDAITCNTWAPAASPWTRDWQERCSLLAAYAEALQWLDGLGLGDIGRRMRGRVAGVLARLTCERWWRRILRRLHAQAVEGTARALGLVHKRAGCYVSDQGLARRQGQNKRNARALESVEAVNERQQRYTLAELAARGPANREIRRHELMTRIAGFETIARDCDHAAYFVTVTCPSRMHAWRTRPGSTWATQANPAFDGTTPDAAQRHLSKQWARFRAAAERAGLNLYGFRIAEPNHDGTPHWHLLLFFPQVATAATTPGRKGRAVGAGGRPGSDLAGRCKPNHSRPAYRVAVRLLRRYFLHACDGTEPGARRHRVKVERIDWQRGSAAGYIAKYVAKNIDGYAIERDLYGNEALTASARVDAWASTWRVRQFQQIGGAPVGVWRELRRLHPDMAGASAGLGLALDAVNVAASEAAAESEAVKRYTAAHAWATYTELQGGPRVKRRSLRLRLLREQLGVCGRYGDIAPPRAVGVELDEVTTEHRPAFGIVRASTVRRQITTQAESERADWIVVPKGTPAVALPAQQARDARSAAPWSPVNNCTAAIDAAHIYRRAGVLDQAPGALFAPQVQRHAKLGRWANWKRGPGGHPSEQAKCPSPPAIPRPSRPN